MFSKPVFNFIIQKNTVKNNILTHNNLLPFNNYEKNRDLTKYKLRELKEIAKQCNLLITATKPVLIKRIENHFNKITYYCIKIQKNFRGYIARQFIKLKGPGFKNLSICVNDTDFITLDPLSEIEPMFFFSYSIDDITFGCNIISLAQYIKTYGIKYQPYNRSQIPENIIDDLHKLYKLTNILYDIPENYQKNLIKDVNREPINQIEILRERLINIRNNSIETRIQELFIEMDQLGNYTNSIWFSSLTMDGYMLFYRSLYTIWNYNGRISADLKEKIYILGDPFIGNINEGGLITNIGNLKGICLFVFENFVYGGIDDEHRKIGTMHALTALTIVSMNARNSMYWLYESLG